MKKAIPAALLGSAILALAPSWATAGPGDSAVPSISNSQATRVMFMIPGVIKNNGLESAFMCTSLEQVDTTFAVEIFDPATGAVLNNVAVGTANGALTLPAGATKTIS